jgi:hypothetical protein
MTSATFCASFRLALQCRNEGRSGISVAQSPVSGWPTGKMERAPTLRCPFLSMTPEIRFGAPVRTENLSSDVAVVKSAKDVEPSLGRNNRDSWVSLLLRSARALFQTSQEYRAPKTACWGQTAASCKRPDILRVPGAVLL